MNLREKMGLAVDIGHFCTYLKIINLSKHDLSFKANTAIYQLLKKSELNLTRISALEILGSEQNNNEVKLYRVLTGEATTLFIYDKNNHSLLDLKKEEMNKDFKWLSGIPDDRLDDIGFGEIDEDIESVSLTNVLTKTILPNIKDQINMLSINWSKNLASMKNVNQPNSIPKVFNFVWIAKDVGGITSELKQSHKVRLKTWLDQNGSNFEYWIWTDAKSEADIGLEEIREHASDLGISDNLKVMPITKALGYAKQHFTADKKIQGDSSLFEEQVTYLEIFDSIQLFIKCDNVGVRSDVLKFMILYLYGGVYLDINDTECIKPFDQITKPFDFIACMEPHGFINTAIAASKQYSKVLLCYLCNLWWQKPFIEALDIQILRYKSHLAKNNYNAIDTARLRNAIDVLVVRRSGPVAFTKAVLGCLSNNTRENIAILPSAYWYPGWGLMSKHTKNDWIKDISLANHYDERAYVGNSVSAADESIDVALGNIAGSSNCGVDNHL